MNWLKRLFRQPSVKELAATELAEAERHLLIAQAGHEWAKANIDYNQARCDRLRAYLTERTPDTKS